MKYVFIMAAALASVGCGPSVAEKEAAAAKADLAADKASIEQAKPPKLAPAK